VAERKRGNGEGSKPRKRPDGRWEARYTDAQGKRRSVYGTTRKEVAGKLADAIAHKDEAPAFKPTNITVRDFFAEYKDAVRHSLKRRSFENVRDVIRLHLLPELGTTKLKDLSREQVQRMYNEKLTTGLSAARVSCVHRVLSAALNTAVRWHYLPHNVCREVSAPRVPAPEVRPLSLDEAKRFLTAAEGDRLEALYVLGLTSGARWGELAGLYWSSLDLERRIMRIERSLINAEGGLSLDSPKTRGSVRSVGLTIKATEALIRHRERQVDEGHLVEGNALVFTNTVGRPLHASNFIRRNFKPLLQRTNLPDTNWHAATRHTCTCILLLEGVNPKSVAMQMGWSSVAFMLENYARFLPGWGDNGAMDSALSETT
jgi:integrase